MPAIEIALMALPFGSTAGAVVYVVITAAKDFGKPRGRR